MRVGVLLKAEREICVHHFILRSPGRIVEHKVKLLWCVISRRQCPIHFLLISSIHLTGGCLAWTDREIFVLLFVEKKKIYDRGFITGPSALIFVSIGFECAV